MIIKYHRVLKTTFSVLESFWTIIFEMKKINNRNFFVNEFAVNLPLFGIYLFFTNKDQKGGQLKYH